MQTLLTALKAAAEPTRIRLLGLCAHADLTVSDLTQILGQSQPRVSRHLRLLWDAGLIDRIQEGSWAYFRLTTRGAVADLGRTLIDALPADDPQLGQDLRRLDTIRAARAEAAAHYFARNAKRWDEIRSLYVDETEVEQALVSLLPAGRLGDALDVGTGTGRILMLLAPHAERAIGLDLSREMLAVARAGLEGAGIRNCELRQGDMYHLPLPSASIDLITLHHVLHYAQSPAQVIAEAHRVLRPDGRLIVIDFAAHELDRLRDQHAHTWLGFRDPDVHEWFNAAGLTHGEPIRLAGDPLTVVMWPAHRPQSMTQH